MANSPRLAELADLITRREYNYALCKARKHEEDLVRRYASEHCLEYTTLADTIEALYQDGVIDDVSRENLHGIRVLGNAAVHEGDNDAGDAKNAYDLLKKELTTYSDRRYTNPVRTPVAVGRREEAAEAGVRRRARSAEEASEETGEIDMSYAGRRQPARSGNRNTSGKSSKKTGRSKSGESTLYTVLKILIPVLIIILLVILILSLFPKNEEAEPETEVTTEASLETTEEETTEETTTEAPTTEAPTTEPPVTWQTKGDGVRFRFASDPDQIYTTVNKGTFIGPVEDYENKTGKSDYDNFAKFTYDGKELIVRKDLIEKTAN